MSIVIRCENLIKSFEAARAVDNVSLELAEGTITCIIGPNGAGKTTLFNLITGFTRLDSGSIYYMDRDITDLCRKSKSHTLAALGIAQSFQLSRGFGEMTVLESLMVPPTLSNDNSLWSAIKLLMPRRKESSRLEREERANEMAQELGLKEKINETVQDQDVGTQKLIELGQIFLLNPKVFLLDEPLAGVSRNKVPIILDYIRSLRERGKTILMIEHKIEAALNISDVIYVLVDGKVLVSGSPDEILKDKRVKEAYLGGRNAGTK